MEKYDLKPVVELMDNSINKLNKLVTKISSSHRYSKQDLKDAWHHGAVRAPKEFQHLNNFDDYFKFKHGSHEQD